MALSGTMPAVPMLPVLQQLPMSLPCLPRGLVGLGCLTSPKERLFTGACSDRTRGSGFKMTVGLD